MADVAIVFAVDLLPARLGDTLLDGLRSPAAAPTPAPP